MLVTSIQNYLFYYLFDYHRNHTTNVKQGKRRIVLNYNYGRKSINMWCRPAGVKSKKIQPIPGCLSFAL